MAVPKRRLRMVNFRLSEEEYAHLKSICLSEGARSVSDFARSAVCHSMAAARPRNEELDVWLRILDGKVEDLDRAVKQLSEQMARAGRMGRRKRKES